MSSADGGDVPTGEGDEPRPDAAGQTPADLSPEKTADEDVSPEQVEATMEAAEAEGHAEQTAEGVGDEGVFAEPEGEPVAAGVAAASAGVEPEPEPEPTPEPEPARDPTSPDSSDEARLAMLQVFKDELGDAVVGAHIREGQDLCVRVTTEAWRDAAQVLKGKLGCTSFTFLNAIDWLPSPFGRYEDSALEGKPEIDLDAPVVTGYAGGETRFQVFMRANNPSTGLGVTIKADVADPDAGVATIIPVYAGANWHERETWEMYGIQFVGHPHLVHLYLPGEFEGYPGRKDFPLLARHIKPWPGIVDVEPMPDAGDADEEPAAEEASV